MRKRQDNEFDLEMNGQQTEGGKKGRKNKKPLTRRQKNIRRLIILGVEVLLVIILLIALFFIRKVDLIEYEDIGDVEVNDLDEQTQVMMEGYTNIALFGLDNRSNGNYKSGNADTIMIASINNKTKEIRLVSVYRDTYLNVTTEGKYSKINSAYSRNGGAKGMVEALNRNLDLKITEYVSVDWFAVVKTVDLLGGIEIELSDSEAKVINKLVAENERVTGYNTDRVATGGVNELDGVQALAYARIRSLKGSDFARTERQRMVITKMLEKAKNSSVSTLLSIVNEVFPDISTSLSVSELTQLASGILSYNMGETTGFPMDLAGKSISGSGSCVVPVSLETNVKELHKFLFINEEYVPSAKVQEISNYIIDQTGLEPEEEEEEAAE